MEEQERVDAAKARAEFEKQFKLKKLEEE